MEKKEGREVSVPIKDEKSLFAHGRLGNHLVSFSQNKDRFAFLGENKIKVTSSSGTKLAKIKSSELFKNSRKTINRHEFPLIFRMSFSFDSQMLLVQSKKWLIVYDFTKKEPIWTNETKEDQQIKPFWLPKDQNTPEAAASNELIMINKLESHFSVLEFPSLQRKVVIQDRIGCKEFSFNKDFSLLAVIWFEEKKRCLIMSIYSTKNWERQSEINIQFLVEPKILWFPLSLKIATWDSASPFKMFIYRPFSGTSVNILESERIKIGSVFFSNNERSLAIAHKDSDDVSIYNATTCRLIQHIRNWKEKSRHFPQTSFFREASGDEFSKYLIGDSTFSRNSIVEQSTLIHFPRETQEKAVSDSNCTLRSSHTSQTPSILFIKLDCMSRLL